MDKRFLTSAFLFYVCIVIVSSSWSRNHVALENNQYNNVLIAINKNVTYDQEIINRIKEIFTSGSSRLFEATNSRAYWKNITILVPKSWAHRPEYEVVKTESFGRANVVIDTPNPRYEDNPYTKQLGGCGEKGEYIHLTPRFLLDKTRSEYIWGPMDKLLVHEWGHLQWGLFDEYSTDETAAFYAHSNQNVEATRCSLAIKGKYINIDTQKDCYLDPATGVYQSECAFFPYTAGQRATASIMYGQFIETVNTFCHSDPSDPLGYHDVEAPHKHNILCNYKSSWDVMLESSDFKDGNNPPLASDTDTTPTFRIVQPTDRRVVLVLDTSGSMSGDRILQLLQASTYYLLHTIDEGSYVGIVEFSYSATVLSELVCIVNEQSRADLVALLPTYANGGTSIESGVLKGIEVLSRGGEDPAGSYVLVISDGINNDPTGISGILDDVKNAGVIIDTIAFTDHADYDLKKLSDVSDGIFYYFDGKEDISVLNDAFTATVTSRPDLSIQDLPITLYSEGLVIVPYGAVNGSVYIDSSVGLDTIFSFSWINNDRIQVFLKMPDGQLLDPSLYNTDVTSKTITIGIDGTAMIGRWEFRVVGSRYSDVVTVNVQSKKSSEEEPIEVLAIVGDPSVNYTGGNPNPVIYAIVTQGYLPVINVHVTAIISGPSNTVIEIKLLDNGASADITKNDGVYSGYFQEISGNGRYSVTIKVDNSAQTAAVNAAKSTGSLPIKPDTSNNELPVYSPPGMFTRTASGGAIEVSGYSYQANDVVAPSRISDLSVLETSYSEEKVVLQWTAVGDDLDRGNASRYELKIAKSFSELQRNFSSASEIQNDDIIIGNITIASPPGVVERITLKVSAGGQNATYFFAIRAYDESGNAGAVSNIVSANMQYIPPIPASVNSTDLINATSIFDTTYYVTITDATSLANPTNYTDRTTYSTKSTNSTGSTNLTHSTNSTEPAHNSTNTENPLITTDVANPTDPANSPESTYFTKSTNPTGSTNVIYSTKPTEPAHHSTNIKNPVITTNLASPAANSPESTHPTEPAHHSTNSAANPTYLTNTIIDHTNFKFSVTPTKYLNSKKPVITTKFPKPTDPANSPESTHLTEYITPATLTSPNSKTDPTNLAYTTVSYNPTKVVRPTESIKEANTVLWAAVGVVLVITVSFAVILFGVRFCKKNNKIENQPCSPINGDDTREIVDEHCV
ncbi:calcium-activated chloride channel regulator 1-like [Anneissia japonica]|uniref:calcium-activated chloride channel regulator 1-like n=1 Tax=Anneissia japonica TaxID=1529436 RepID=UPI0014256339|nr:calcium-activated chloride channel regulator 1-like [Anneissia japonica]